MPASVRVQPAPRVVVRDWRGKVSLVVGCGTVDMTTHQARVCAAALIHVADQMDAAATDANARDGLPAGVKD